MRTKVTVAAVAAALLAAVPATAGSARGQRVVTKAYTGAGSANAATAEAHNYCLEVGNQSTGSACFRVASRDRRVAVVVEDAAGGDVAARIVLEGRPDVRFCGATKGSIAIPRGQKQLPVALEIGGCGDPAGTVPSSGTITAAFTNR